MTTRLILVILALATSLTHAQSAQELANRFDRAYTGGRYELALKTAERLTELYPDSAWWQFQTGLVHSRLDQVDDALFRLERAAELGFSGLRSAEQNTDLDAARSDPRFSPILEKIRSNAEKRMGEFQEVARDHEPLSYVPVAQPGAPLPGLIIALHGTGMDGRAMHDSLLPIATELGMILISPDALRPAGEGYSWTYRDESEWFVKHIIERAVATHQVDTSRIYLVGFSQGANIALIMGQTHPELFRGVLPICGHYEPQSVRASDPPAPFYLLTGARDPWRKTYNTAKSDFIEEGGEAQLRIMSTRGHELPTGATAQREYMRAFIWFDRAASPANQSP